ncbi:SRPBCC domain-containing protein [Paraneptunicella aestuarii]|uniref:SRPBCC family protein n=1 Tax=Paraneptunicella aestuarii TaxID=2831148 RepID=UPI001E378C13|nr:SRPBCC family protein [Paraneptunicella aestuarii]UAA38626.1 SRPBCC domain-containing protein [Paraneptunicella aestuarii]
MQHIHLELALNAKLEKVYHAFISPDMLQKWFNPLGMTVQQAMSNSIIDGQFRLLMTDPAGNQHILVGRYQEMKTNESLKFSWQWQDEPHQTQVVLAFSAINDSTTQLILDHGEFEDEEDFELHCQAWMDCLDQLSVLLGAV